MSDIHKFRVWSEKLKRYYWNYAINVDGDLVPWTEGIGKEDEDPGSKLTVEHCTGIKDKNDKLIYAGDVVKTVTGAIGEVRFLEHLAGFYVRFMDANFCKVVNSQEIIGNVHDMGME